MLHSILRRYPREVRRIASGIVHSMAEFPMYFPGSLTEMVGKDMAEYMDLCNHRTPLSRIHKKCQ